MLLGHFLKQIGEGEATAVNIKDLAPGSIAVAVQDMPRLRETGLPSTLRFGIVISEHKVVCRCCEEESIERPRFVVKELSDEEFAADGMSIYECKISGKRSPQLVVMAARMNVGIQAHRICSYPGDDFVAECLTGLSSEELVAADSKIGQHWWTPLRMTLREGLMWLGVKVPAGWLPTAADVQVFDQTHHGIAIEGDSVIHFSTRRVPDGANRIKTDSLREFRSIGDDDLSGSAVKYKEETPEQRLNSRNRAVWVFCHADSWGAYNLMDNNCEHFSRYCRVGKKESRQVIAAVMEALGELISILPRSIPFRPLIIALSLLMKSGAKVLGRPVAAPAEEEQTNTEDLPLSINTNQNFNN